MGRKKKPRKKKPPQSPTITPEEKARVTSLLGELEGADPKDIVDRIPNAQTAAFFIDLLPLKKFGDLPQLIDKNKTPHLIELILQGVKQVEHKPGGIPDRA